MKRAERNAIANFAMGVLSDVIVHVLRKLPVNKVREFLSDHKKMGERLGSLDIIPEHIAGFSIPRMFLDAAGGSIAGLTVATIVRKIHPGISDDMEDYLQDLALMVVEKYGDLPQNTDTSTSDSSPQQVRGAERVTPMAAYRNWFVSSAMPTVVFCENCGVAHHLEIRQVPVGGGARNQPQRTEPKPFLKPGFRAIAFEDAMASGAHAPTDAAEGYVAGCLCVRAFATDKATFDRAQAPTTAASPAAKPQSPSFAELTYQVGLEAAAQKKGGDATLANEVEELAVMLGLFEEDEKHDLVHCNTLGEYKALAGRAVGIRALLAVTPLDQEAIAAKKAQFATYMQQLRSDNEVGRLAHLLGEFSHLAAPVSRFVRNEPKRIEKSDREADGLAAKLAKREAVSQYAIEKGTSITAVQTYVTRQLGQSVGLDDIDTALVDQAIASNPQLVKHKQDRSAVRATKKVVRSWLRLFF